MKILIKITDIITKILTALACIYLLYIVFACAMQVFSRYVLNSSFSWTEETARYAFACMGMLGAPVALRKGMHVSVDILETKLFGRYKYIQKIVILICILFVSVVLLKEGYVLFESMDGIYSSAVRLPMQFVYYSVPVCGLVSIWFVIVELIETANKLRKGE